MRETGSTSPFFLCVYPSWALAESTECTYPPNEGLRSLQDEKKMTLNGELFELQHPAPQATGLSQLGLL